MSVLESQICFNFQNVVHAVARQCLKSFIVSFTYVPKYWKLSTISSTVSSSLISGFGSMFFDSTFVLSAFITKPTSLAVLDNASSCFCALSFSSSPISSAYSGSLTLFSGILLDWRLCVVKPKSSKLEFLII